MVRETYRSRHGPMARCFGLIGQLVTTRMGRDGPARSPIRSPESGLFILSAKTWPDNRRSLTRGRHGPLSPHAHYVNPSYKKQSTWMQSSLLQIPEICQYDHIDRKSYIKGLHRKHGRLQHHTLRTCLCTRPEQPPLLPRPYP
jgi:hypothetical protein